jgi:hypothetical protein
MIPDGIYLNLPMEAYRADPALGGGDLAAILANPVQWHARERNRAWRELNPPSEEETAASKFGTALHTMVLEPKAFDSRYHVEPTMPNLPDTKSQIAAQLILRHIKPPATGELKVVFEAQARLYGIKLLDDWKFEQAMERGERTAISAAWARALQLLRNAVDMHSVAPKYLRNGYAEVSVFWTDPDGIRLKCRYDYMRLRPVSDVKSYAHRAGQEPIATFVSAAESFGYDFRAAHYCHMRIEAVPALVGAGHVYEGFIFTETGKLQQVDADDMEFFVKAAAEPEPAWCWIACMTQGFPEVDAIEFPMSLMQFSVAAAQVDLARQTYREFRERFGDDPETPWRADRGLVRLTDFNFMSNRAKDRGSVKWEQG